MTKQTSKVIALAALAGLIIGLIGCASVRAFDNQTPTQPMPPVGTGSLVPCPPTGVYFCSSSTFSDNGKGYRVLPGTNYVTVVLTNKTSLASSNLPTSRYRLKYWDVTVETSPVSDCASPCGGLAGQINMCFRGMNNHSNIYIVYFLCQPPNSRDWPSVFLNITTNKPATQ